MVSVVESIFIYCPVEQVYSFVSDPRDRTKYDPGVIEVRLTPESPVAIGTKIVEVRKFMWFPTRPSKTRKELSDQCIHTVTRIEMEHKQ